MLVMECGGGGESPVRGSKARTSLEVSRMGANTTRMEVHVKTVKH